MTHTEVVLLVHINYTPLHLVHQYANFNDFHFRNDHMDASMLRPQEMASNTNTLINNVLVIYAIKRLEFLHHVTERVPTSHVKHLT